MLGMILAQCYMTLWAARPVSVDRAGAGCPVTHTGCQIIQLKVQQGEASPCWSQAPICFPLKLFSVLYLLSSSPSLHLGVFPAAHHWQLSQHWQQQKFNQTSPQTGQIHRASFVPSVATREIHSSNKQEVQFLNVGVLQHSFRHQKKFSHLYSCRWKGYRSKSKIYIAHSAITLG